MTEEKKKTLLDTKREVLERRAFKRRKSTVEDDGCDADDIEGARLSLKPIPRTAVKDWDWVNKETGEIIASYKRGEEVPDPEYLVKPQIGPTIEDKLRSMRIQAELDAMLMDPEDEENFDIEDPYDDFVSIHEERVKELRYERPGDQEPDPRGDIAESRQEPLNVPKPKPAKQLKGAKKVEAEIVEDDDSADE